MPPWHLRPEGLPRNNRDRQGRFDNRKSRARERRLLRGFSQLRVPQEHNLRHLRPDHRRPRLDRRLRRDRRPLETRADKEEEEEEESVINDAFLFWSMLIFAANEFRL